MIDGRQISPDVLQPRRNPGLVSRVWQALSNQRPDLGPQPESQQTTESGIVRQLHSAIYERHFNISFDRRSIYKDAEEMDAQSEEISTALDTIRSNVTTSEDGRQMSFTALAPVNKRQDATTAARVQKVLDRATDVCQLHRSIKPFIRNFIKCGDAFGELIVSGQYELVGFKQLPPATIRHNVDQFGNDRLGVPKYGRDASGNNVCINAVDECAFEQIDPENDDALVATFLPWQIVHAKLNWDGYSPYGQSLLKTTRVAYRKLKAIEESMVVGRLVRDLMKLVFYIDVTGLNPKDREAAVTNFRRNIQQRQRVDGRRENPFAVMTELFMTDGYVRVNGQPLQMRTRVEMLDPKNEGLREIRDVEYFHRKMITTLRVPPAHMGFEKEVNSKSTVTQQDVQYVRWLRDLQQDIGHMLEQIYDTALVLEGIDPNSVEYEIVWPQLKATDDLAAAQAEYHRAQAAAIWLGNSQQNMTPVVDARFLQEKFLDMGTDDIDTMTQRMEEEEAENQQEAAQQADQQHQRQLEVIKTQAAVASQKRSENGNGRGPDGVQANPGQGRAVNQSVTMLGALLAERVADKVLVPIAQLGAEGVITEAAATELDELVGTNGRL